MLDYAPGEGMKQQAHQEIYRVAYESANSELISITEEFERLRGRMRQIEGLVAALKPIVFEGENDAIEAAAQEAAPEPAAEAETPAENAPEPARTGSDPFQHRINHVL